MGGSRFVIAGLTVLALAAPSTGSGQLPLSPITSSGQAVTPVFEGWYRNPDGTFSISFGYFNRNAEETLEIPIGPDNYITPGDSNQGQPTHFEARRHWGVFAVKVPANFGATQKVIWTLRIRGQTYAIPGRLHPDWEIDALQGEAGSGNTPPSLRFDTEGPESRGPGGITVGPLSTAVGKPLAVTIWASDDGRAVGSIANAGRGAVPVTLTWFKHQGPGAVSFAPQTMRVTAPDGKSSTTATFSQPGSYILRVRANDASGVANAGHAQCCWTNGFVKVTVTPQ